MSRGKETPLELELIEAAKDQRERYCAFFEKLTARAEEFCEAAIPELKELHSSDPDIHLRAYHRFLASVEGQLNTIKAKAREARDTQLIDFFGGLERRVGFGTKAYSRLHEIKNEMYAASNRFEENVSGLRMQLKQTEVEDLELKYQEILEEFEATRNNYNCVQCGSQLPIDRLYIITTYVTCESCRSQNSFEPSALSRQLQYMARGLAEQRAKPLLDEYNRTRNAGDYKQYLRKMFDEWNSIVPEIAKENEKFYDRMLRDFSPS